MRTKNIFAEHQDFEINESESKFYHDAQGAETKEPIVFITFGDDVEYDELTADYAVCSRAVAKELRTKKNYDEAVAFLSNCKFERNDEGDTPQFAIIKPAGKLLTFGKKSE